ncbi:Molecular chaperone DnaJ [Oopsacas minuta]|uniref:Molecular chaperone DnaJ n=1 Tax=Oopsacas minuta TaxID=111878 RepID=A0AAV7KJG6_9METZ|nr:Molecular chaperone DnaJ [Oopsacas minuta]
MSVFWMNNIRLLSLQCRSLSQFSKSRDLDPYEILGIKLSATQDEIKKAYHNLSFKYHPDRNQGSKESHAKFTKLTRAYKMLSDIDERRRFDKSNSMANEFSRGFTPHIRRSNISRVYVHSSRKIYNFEEYTKNHYPGSYYANKKRDTILSSPTHSYEKGKQARIIWNTTLALWGTTLLAAILYSVKYADKLN